MSNVSVKPLEVETRFHFTDSAEVFNLLPFFQACFTSNNRWTTVHYGQELFHQDIILRIGTAQSGEGPRTFLGWKGPDAGKFANIREELDEEITNGISHSAILETLGGRTAAATVTEVQAELNRLGYFPFMEFSGTNQFGFYEPLELHLKLLSCPILKWPYLLEIEKTAFNAAQALTMEAELATFTRQHHLENRVVREEPPTLLYQAAFDASAHPDQS